MTSIYLSSTYEDLKEYRRVVFDALRKSGYHAIAMEDYVATDQRPVETCLKDVAEADIYVGIFAFRYGYVPPAEHSNSNSLSITELEFRRAESLKKPCLLFVLRENADWPVNFNDTLNAKDNGDHIRRFREYLLTEKLVEYFSSPHELAALVLASVTRLQRENKNTEEAKKQKTETPPVMTRSHLPIRGTMSDIFISYKREEQPQARKLAVALEREGWTVWWDPKLRAGEHFDDVIEQALKDSKCVVVMWSKLSVTSRYVKDEAAYALKRDKLVPVAIEEVQLPFRFEGLHTPLLCDWDGADDFPEFRKLVEDIKAILGEPARKTRNPNIPAARLLEILHQQDNPDYYWESALFKREPTPLERIFKEDDKDEEGYHYMRRTCRVKVINNGEKTIKDVVLKLEQIEPQIDMLVLPLQLKFTEDDRSSIDLHPHEYRFVDVIYWEFPRGRTAEEQWDLQYHICGLKKAVRISQSNYRIKLVAYGLNVHADKILAVGKPMVDGGIHKEIWMHD